MNDYSNADQEDHCKRIVLVHAAFDARKLVVVRSTVEDGLGHSSRLGPLECKSQRLHQTKPFDWQGLSISPTSAVIDLCRLFSVDLCRNGGAMAAFCYPKGSFHLFWIRSA
ncbi:MAG: hypothetical protein ABFD92_17355, partial [Planctomycetaceae bacterium]